MFDIVHAPEGEGFEPSVLNIRTELFESSPFDHSGIPP